MISLVKTLYIVITFPSVLIGTFALYHIFKPADPPMDRSNVFNRLRIFWFALTRMSWIAQFVPWMQKDEYEIVNKHCDNKNQEIH